MKARRLGSENAAGDALRRRRRFVSACLAIFLAASAAAPHRHKNDLADLLTDGRSDSGVFLDVSPLPSRDCAPLAESARWVHDDPCLACLPFDFAITATAVAHFEASLLPAGRLLPGFAGEIRSEEIPLRPSRSPPGL